MTKYFTNTLFPDCWKEALVSPLLKKSGVLSEFTNLRPVSNLQYVSKLTERVVFDQTHAHLTSHGLYPPFQSAYRKCHSTETALLKVQNDILMNLDSQCVTLLVLLDLSAAFDTVDHGVLLNRLNTSFGVRGSALQWFTSYLLNRSQRVSCDQNLSEKFNLQCGVPQGSCLGLLLFTIYASKLFEVIKNYLPQSHAYADDTQLYLSFNANSACLQNDAVEAMEQCIQAIRSWMIKDKLRLNDSKTEFMIIGTRKQLAKVNIGGLSVGESIIAPVTSVRNLRSWFDQNLSMTSHINKICKAVWRAIQSKFKIRQNSNIFKNAMPVLYLYSMFLFPFFYTFFYSWYIFHITSLFFIFLVYFLYSFHIFYIPAIFFIFLLYFSYSFYIFHVEF